MAQDISEAMVGFAAGLSWDDVPQDTRTVLLLSLLDWCAVGVAGIDEPVSVAVRDMVLAEKCVGKAALIGGGKSPARAAALVNGATSHALDYDDTHFLHIGHPGVVIFSATMAMAGQVGATGRAFLEAALVGFETSCRIGHWLGRSHYEAGFHMTATAGCFGAALAAARLLGATPVQMRHALGLAATRASGQKGQFGSMGKPYNAGLAAANGVEVALLAVAGFASDLNGLEGFAANHAGECAPAALAGLGQRYVTKDVSHKFHACCHGIHAMLEALAQLEIEAAQVHKVQITVHPRWLNVCNLAAPATGLEAKFSYRICAAFALAGLDTGALDTFSEAHCRDPGLVALRNLVSVAGDAALADGAARVIVTLKSGKTLSAHFDLDQPLALKQHVVRVQRKAEGLIGKPQAQALWQRIKALEGAEEVRVFENL